MTQVFFFRGLSTKGGDDVRFAFMNWGMMYAHLQRDLKPLGVALHPIIGMGGGSFEDQAAIAAQFIRQHPAWTDSNEMKPNQNRPQKFHLLGHSAGGLIARKTLNLLSPIELQRIESLVTIASPHNGSRLAQACLTAPEQHPKLTALMRLIGYNVSRGAKFYRQLTSQAIDEQFRNWQAPPHIRLASIICGPPKEFWSWPLKVAHWLPPVRRIDLPSDGILEAESQKFGEVLGHFNLDHLCQLGVYQKPEYFKMCQTLAKFWQTAST